MAKIDSAFLDLGYLDTLATGTSPVHRLDPRVKVLLAVIFVICVVSFDKYAIAAQLPFAVVLVLVMGIGRVPVDYILKKLVLVSPFAFFVAIFNPFFDRQVGLMIGPLAVSGGWLSFCSIILRFCLTVGAMLVLIATTGFNSVCMALERLGMPKVFAVQLLMLYRYIFVLVEEGQRVYRARALRSFGSGLPGMAAFSQMIGQLLLRTLDRAQRVHLAMLCRGFDGTIRIRRTLRLSATDVLLLLTGSLLLIGLRFVDLPQLLGRLLTGTLS